MSVNTVWETLRNKFVGLCCGMSLQRSRRSSQIAISPSLWFHWWRRVTSLKTPPRFQLFGHNSHAQLARLVLCLFQRKQWLVDWCSGRSGVGCFACLINVWAVASENSAAANVILNNRWNRRNLLIFDRCYLTFGPSKMQIWSVFAPQSPEEKNVIEQTFLCHIGVWSNGKTWARTKTIYLYMCFYTN